MNWVVIPGGALECIRTRDTDDDYRVISDGRGGWRAKCGREVLTWGKLEECLMACKRDLLNSRRRKRAHDLRIQINSLVKSQGGSWRTIKRANLLRTRLEKLEGLIA